ncbi:MAG: miaB [Chlamydiales bacterium]|jgi:tRNA-2-methylthio-N6-dimethylallyladenosine synthase|nr:miaB [Chlamydiales bacterium]
MRQQPKTFHIRTYGCQMNELDAEVMSGQLSERGLAKVEEESAADLLIFNTCSIRDLAERKVMGKLGKLGRVREKNQIIGVTGCMANAKKDSLFRKLPHIDFVLGTNNIHDLNHMLDQLLLSGKQQHKTDERFSYELNYLAAKRDDPIKAYVSIIRGCNKYCTYCVVPYTRGPEVSRPIDSILDECRHLADQGYKEITLLGQNVNSYGNDQPDWNIKFPDLLYAIDRISGIERVRFMTSHPYDITRGLMEAIRDLKSACEFVHFPIQHGSDRILRKMHRLYTLDSYQEKVAELRELVPGVALGTDIICGFPTETEEDFEKTVEALKTIKYAAAFLFAYSPRQGTPAMRWKDDITEEIKQARLHRLLDVQEEIVSEQLQGLLGSEMEVLVENSTKEGALLKGRSRCWRKVLFEAPSELIGTLQKVKIHSFSRQTLLGTLV